MTIRLLAVAVAAVLTSGTSSAVADPTPCPTTNVPNELVLMNGSGQTARLGKPFGTPLQAQLQNTNGCPLTGNLAGRLVVFDAPAGGASGTFPSTGSTEAVVGTDAQGTATAPAFTANAVAGSYTVTAHTDVGSVGFALTNTATGVPAQLAAVGATTQTADVNAQYAQPLQVRVLDANGNPIAGVAVAFSVAAGPTGAAATFAGAPQAAATTGTDGVATAPALVANAAAGSFTATASVEGIATAVVYRLDNHASAQSLTGGTARLATRVGTTFAKRLRATVRDPSGNPVEGVTVTFAIASTQTGAGATFVVGTPEATAVTGADGVAVSPRLVANTVAGSFGAVASAPSSTAVARYTLTNKAGAPAAIAAGAASGQSAPVRTHFPVRLAVTVTDAHGNPVPHAAVVFRAPARGASGHFARLGRRVRVATDAQGIAIAPPFVAGGQTGGYAVTATVSGKRVAFALVNEPRG